MCIATTSKINITNLCSLLLWQYIFKMVWNVNQRIPMSFAKAHSWARAKPTGYEIIKEMGLRWTLDLLFGGMPAHALDSWIGAIN